ncbi:NUDIX domain-containing protein [Pseudactinotalea sp. Z1748]|uniref:NUDIX domain-containing protein n=1 Tax=Pseudactinotalea sp. Z1748 TaxID=3413027 RepID=UPI003C7E70CE
MRSSQDGDGWVSCGCGQRHWGRYGAAGLLLADGGGQVVLQHRAPWSHHGGTWGIPGGARNAGESAVQAAVREAGEEAGVQDPVLPHASHELAHPDWSYTTVLAHVPGGMQVRATDAESVQVRWYPVDRVTALPLLGAFAEAWPLLRRMLRTRAVLVVDAANVVGARPDGWWKDRAGATTRLASRLAALAGHGVAADALGLPGHTWWPAMVLVTEGAARAADDVAPVHTVRAHGEGDEEIVRTVRRALGGGFSTVRAGSGQDDGQDDAGDRSDSSRAAELDVHVSVVTADRALRERVSGAGAQVLGPGRLWQLLDALET